MSFFAYISGRIVLVFLFVSSLILCYWTYISPVIYCLVLRTDAQSAGRNEEEIHVLKRSFFSCICFRLPVVSECSPQQTARVSVAAGSSGSVSAAASAAAAAAVVAGAPSSSTMSVSRVPSPPPSSEANTPVAENWCYTQVRTPSGNPFWHFVDDDNEMIIKCFDLSPRIIYRSLHGGPVGVEAMSYLEIFGKYKGNSYFYRISSHTVYCARAFTAWSQKFSGYVLKEGRENLVSIIFKCLSRYVNFFCFKVFYARTNRRRVIERGVWPPLDNNIKFPFGKSQNYD